MAAGGRVADMGGDAGSPWAVADAVALGLLVLWCVLFFLRIHVGIDVTDEGMYLSTIDRLCRGDLPFRDDQENPLRQFDVLIAMLGRPFGGYSIIGLRCVGIFLQVAQMAALWVVVRRWRGAWIAALTAGLIPCLPLYGIWTPGYNETATAMVVIAGACLACMSSTGGGSRRAVIGWAVAAGVALALAWLCYLPAVALAVVPVLMMMMGFWRGGGGHPWRLGGAVTLATAGTVVAIDAAGIVLAGLGPDWLAAVRDTISLQQSCVPLGQRVWLSMGILSGPFWQVLVTGSMFACIRWIFPRFPATIAAWMAAALIAAALAIDLSYLPAAFVRPGATNFFGASPWMMRVILAEMEIGVAGAAVFVVPDACAAWWRGRTDADAGVGVAMVVFLVFAAICAIASTIVGFNAMHIRAAVLALGAAGIAGYLARWPARMPPLAVAFAGQLLVAALLGIQAWQLVNKDARPAECTATFSHAPLLGLRSTPVQVEAVDALCTWIDAHEPRDARMIAYSDLPGLYFASGRLPALDWTWTSPYWSWVGGAATDDFSTRMLGRMMSRGTAPAFCVRHLAEQGLGAPGFVANSLPHGYCLADPLHAYVNAHFRPAWRRWPFEVLVPRDAATPWQEPRMLLDFFASSDHDDAAARVFLSQGVALDHRADGALVLTAPASAGDTMAIALFQHGGDEVALRLRLEGDGSLYPLVSDEVDGERTTNACAHGSGGWDATFIGGVVRDRGFALVLRGGAPDAERHCVIRGLSLAQFPALTASP